MKWLRTILVLALVPIWTTATLHCQLEELPGFQLLACCDHENTAPHQDDDCETDACAVVEEGFYKTTNPKVTVPLPTTAATVDLLETHSTDWVSVSFRARQLTEKSPALPATWQFTLRTALSPRAPSLVS